MAISTATAATTTQAVDALLKWKSTQSDSHNPQLLPEDDFLYLILTLKKIPQKGGINGARTNPNKIPLPHPLISPTSFAEICLIIDDRPKSNLTSKIAKQKIKEEGISVTKVIKLSKLKTDYKPFEAKRKLCDSYEMFFADKRVIPLLPKLLGKQFFKKKKLPLPVDLTHKNWKEQIERGCSSGLLFFRTGTCCVIRVAKVSMERDEIIENVSAAITGAIEFVPKKLLGVRSLHLKFSDSVALPLYQCLPDIKLRIEGVVKEKNVEEEVVKVEEVGKKKKSAKKERIHEVNHDVEMIDDEDEKDEKEDEEEEEEEEEEIEKKVELSAEKEKPTKKSGDKKKRKGNEVNENKSDKKAKKVSKKVEEDEKEEIENSEEVVKSAKKSAKEKKRKVEVIEVKDKKSKKQAEKQNGDSGKKEKKKSRSVSRA